METKGFTSVSQHTRSGKAGPADPELSEEGKKRGGPGERQTAPAISSVREDW